MQYLNNINNIHNIVETHVNVSSTVQKISVISLQVALPVFPDIHLAMVLRNKTYKT